MADFNPTAFLAKSLRASAAALYAAAEKMPEDRIAWHPTTEGNAGRDALDQIVECGYLNEWATAAFKNGALPPFDENDYKKQKDAHRNQAAAIKWLRDGTNALAAAIDGFPASKLGETLENPFTEQTTTWADFALFFYWNTVYHEGQVNYIQVLYGDMS